jgi:hypothetical protein
LFLDEPRFRPLHRPNDDDDVVHRYGKSEERIAIDVCGPIYVMSRLCTFFHYLMTRTSFPLCETFNFVVLDSIILPVVLSPSRHTRYHEYDVWYLFLTLGGIFVFFGASTFPSTLLNDDTQCHAEQYIEAFFAICRIVLTGTRYLVAPSCMSYYLSKASSHDSIWTFYTSIDNLMKFRKIEYKIRSTILWTTHTDHVNLMSF